MVKPCYEAEASGHQANASYKAKNQPCEELVSIVLFSRCIPLPALVLCSQNQDEGKGRWRETPLETRDDFWGAQALYVLRGVCNHKESLLPPLWEGGQAVE